MIKIKNLALFLLTVTFVVSSVMLTGCKSTKTSGTSPKEEVYKPVNQEYTTVQADLSFKLPMISSLPLKGKLSAEVGVGFTISIKPLLGIELYRITCTQDRIIIIDKVRRRYTSELYADLTDSNYNLNYGMVEGLFLNRYFDPLQEDYKNLEVTKENAVTILRKQAPNYYVEFQSDGNLNRTLFSQNDKSEYILAEYSSFKEVSGYKFPGYAVCSVSSKAMNFSVNIDFSGISFNREVSISTSVPSSYKKCSIESIFK